MLISCLMVSTQVPPAVELLLLGEEEARGGHRSHPGRWNGNCQGVNEPEEACLRG